MVGQSRLEEPGELAGSGWRPGSRACRLRPAGGAQDELAGRRAGKPRGGEAHLRPLARRRHPHHQDEGPVGRGRGPGPVGRAMAIGDPEDAGGRPARGGGHRARSRSRLPWTPEMFEEELKQDLSWREVASRPSGGRWPAFSSGALSRRVASHGPGRRAVGAPAWRGGPAAAATSSGPRTTAGRPVLLEVRPGNTEARRPLRGSGVSRRSALRRRYYSDTGEDALVMMRAAGAGRNRPRRRAVHAGRARCLPSSRPATTRRRRC